MEKSRVLGTKTQSLEKKRSQREKWRILGTKTQSFCNGFLKRQKNRYKGISGGIETVANVCDPKRHRSSYRSDAEFPALRICHGPQKGRYWFLKKMAKVFLPAFATVFSFHLQRQIVGGRFPRTAFFATLYYQCSFPSEKLFLQADFQKQPCFGR